MRILVLAAVLFLGSGFDVAVSKKACTPGRDCPPWCRKGQDPVKDRCRPLSSPKDIHLSLSQKN